MPYQTVKTKAKCIKCRGNNLTLTEIWDGASISFNVVDGKREVNGCSENGECVSLRADCWNCNHSWYFRKIINAEDLDE